MGQNIQVFNHKMFGNIRTLTTEKGETFFVGKDVAKALGYAKPENALATHVEKEDKTTTLIQGTGSNYKSKTVLINESGLYALILSSKLEQERDYHYYGLNGEKKERKYLVWTKQGKKFIEQLICMN